MTAKKKHFNLNLMYADGKKKIHILLLDTVMQLVIADCHIFYSKSRCLERLYRQHSYFIYLASHI